MCFGKIDDDDDEDEDEDEDDEDEDGNCHETNIVSCIFLFK